MEGVTKRLSVRTLVVMGLMLMSCTTSGCWSGASACDTGCPYSGGGGGGPVRTCPVNIVKVGVCSPLLGGVGPECCPLLGLLGVDIEICLCLALDVNVLGIVDVNIPKLDIIASIMTPCGFTPTPGFVCPH